MDASNLLKPALAGGQLCAASARPPTRNTASTSRRTGRWCAASRRSTSTSRRSTDAIKILKGLKPYFEEFHKVRYTDDAIKAAVELSARYINDRKLPDKAIDVIDETGASQMLLPEGKRKKMIGVKEIEETVATMARIPPKTVSKNDAEVLRELDEDLKRVVFGQDKAIEALAAAIKLARAGLREPEKPIGCYLFSGPTGVGKTEVAKQLADALGIELLRFDMSEYMERHTVSRLIGAPPGYVGFDQGGLLTDGVDQHPHCVLLLDEIEKAHPDLFNILLQVMDHGKLTDHNGKTVDFRNVILIMTTNAGRAGPCQGRHRLRPQASARATTRKRSTGCSRRSSATGSTRSIALRPSAAGDRRARWCRSSSCSSRRSWPTRRSRSSCREDAADWLAETRL